MGAITGRTDMKKQIQQAGMVSLMVTFVMMIVISLIVLGFSEATRRNTRESLDRQLSTQAYYAAETGINDARSKLRAGTPLLPTHATTCEGNGSFMKDSGLTATNGPVILDSHNTNVTYTCLLVTDKLQYIKEDTVNLQRPAVKVIHMSTAGALNFTWSPSDLTSSPSGCPGSVGSFTDSDSFIAGCKYGLLRLDLVPTGTAADVTSLAGATHTFYFQPTNLNNNTDGDYNSDNGGIVGANCSGTTCTVRLVNLSGTDFYARLAAVYSPLKSIVINGDPGSNMTFTGAGYQIDATGQAQDELRRIQVRIPLNGSGTIPQNALSSADGICKRFTVSTTPPADKASPDYNASPPLCDGSTP